MNTLKKYTLNLKLIACLAFIVSIIITFIYYWLFNEVSVVVFYLLCLTAGLGVTIFISPNDIQEKGFLINLFLFVYAINVIFVFLFIISFYYMDGGLFLPIRGLKVPDDKEYYERSIMIAQAWHNHTSPNIGIIKFYGYTYLLGGIYYICDFFGDQSPITPRIFNAMVGGLIPIVVYLIAKLIYNKKIALRSAILSALFPVFIYYSAIMLRDIIIAFLILLSVYLFLIIHRTRYEIKKLLLFFPFTLIIILIYFIRDLSAFALLFGFAIFLFFKKGLGFKILMSLFFILIAVIIWNNINLNTPKMQSYITYTQRSMELFKRVESEDSLGMKYIIGTPFILNIPLRIAYASIMPIPPIKEFNFQSLIKGLGVFLWYFIFPFWFYGMWISRKIPDANLLAILSIIFLVGIAMVSLDIRHKTQFFGFALIQASYAMNILHKKTLSIYFIIIYAIGCLGIIYIWLKFLI